MEARPGDHIDVIETRQRVEHENALQRIDDSRAEDKRRRDERERFDDAMTVAAVMATSAQIAAFEAKLDKYETAVTAALMENEKKLEEARARIEALLDQAYLLDDGRRVFRTEDGGAIFDEFGKEVGPDELDPNMIRPQAPTWEAFKEEKTTEVRIEEERATIVEFQERIDTARDAIAHGNISEADLDALDTDLMVTMPPSVRANVPGIEPMPDLATSFTTSAAAPAIEQPDLSYDPLALGR